MKGIGLKDYPVISYTNPDLKSFFQSMKNKLSSVGCSNFIDETWDMIDIIDYLKGEVLLILVHSINIQNRELFTRN